MALSGDHITTDETRKEAISMDLKELVVLERSRLLKGVLDAWYSAEICAFRTSVHCKEIALQKMEEIVVGLNLSEAEMQYYEEWKSFKSLEEDE